MSLSARIARLEKGRPKGVSIWEVLAGAADPAELDPEDRAALERMYAPPSAADVDLVEAAIAELGHDLPSAGRT